jgi:hypothetical protein
MDIVNDQLETDVRDGLAGDPCPIRTRSRWGPLAAP